MYKFNNFHPYIAYVYEYGKYKQFATPVEIYNYLKYKSELSYYRLSKDPLGMELSLRESIVNDKPFEFTVDYCRANKGTMLMFAPDGHIHACWDSDLTDHAIGSYYPHLRLDMQYYDSNWLRRKVYRIKECSTCKFALFCGGGCQY